MCGQGLIPGWGRRCDLLNLTSLRSLTPSNKIMPTLRVNNKGSTFE